MRAAVAFRPLSRNLARCAWMASCPGGPRVQLGSPLSWSPSSSSSTDGFHGREPLGRTARGSYASLMSLLTTLTALQSNAAFWRYSLSVISLASMAAVRSAMAQRELVSASAQVESVGAAPPSRSLNICRRRGTTKRPIAVSRHLLAKPDLYSEARMDVAMSLSIPSLDRTRLISQGIMGDSGSSASLSLPLLVDSNREESHPERMEPKRPGGAREADEAPSRENMGPRVG